MYLDLSSSYACILAFNTWITDIEFLQSVTLYTYYVDIFIKWVCLKSSLTSFQFDFGLSIYIFRFRWYKFIFNFDNYNRSFNC